jgi:hypothetical protein
VGRRRFFFSEVPLLIENMLNNNMMKHLPMLALLIGLPLLLVSCRKQTNSDQINDHIPGLPPATQIGANTFGFLLNGQPWVPSGNNGTANLSIDFDPGIDNGVMGISGYRIISTQEIQYFGLGIIDSVNLKIPPYTINLSRISLYRFRFYLSSNCYLLSIEDETNSTGSITILKIDRTNRIVSGSFNATLSKINCDSIKITNGRFDMKF